MSRDISNYAVKRGSSVCLFFRTLLALCSLAFFVSSVAISIAPSHPYLKGSSRSSHFSRLNRTSEAGVEGAGEIASTDRPSGLLEPRPERASFTGWENPSPKVLRLLRFYYFRPPPLI